jgi:SAM-dependent methyltransferase
MKNKTTKYFLDVYQKGLEHYWTLVTEKEKELKRFLKIIKKSIRKPKLLDIGCGNGKYIILAAKEGIDSYGIDISPIAIRKAKKEAAKQKVQASFRVGDALNMPYPKNYFDAAIDFSCFTHFYTKDWNKYFRQVRRILKPNGYFLLSVWSKNSTMLSEVNFDPKTSKSNWSLSKAEGVAGHLYSYYFTKKKLISLLKRKGFKIFLIREILLRSYSKIMPGSELRLWFAYCKKENILNDFGK